MPTNDLPSRLEWNEENASQVVADLYRESESDQALRSRLLAAPFEVLNERLVMPETLRGGVFAREKNLATLMLNLPTLGVTRAAMPEGTTEAAEQPDFEIICTVITQW